MYCPRTMEETVGRASAHFPVLCLTGARQVGKTTLLRHLAGEGRAYVTLDDPLALSLARDEPALFLQRFPGPVLVDEFQYAPQLLPHIKMAVDADRAPGRFWLTGSQHFQMMKAVSESLAGRVGLLSLMGLSRPETLGQGRQDPLFLPGEPCFKRAAASPGAGLALGELYRFIWRGSFPALHLDEGLGRDAFLYSYVGTYLQRDVRDLAQVGDAMAFLRFLRAAAARTGQLLNIAGLARDGDVSQPTAKRWLSILEASGLVYLLPPYFNNVTKRAVKAPKLYFLDTGLAAYLTGWSSPETLEAGAMGGAMLETWVVAEILRNWLHHGQEPTFYYWRDRDQKEIDLLVMRDGVAYPLEVKKTAVPGPKDVAHFALLGKLGLAVGPGAVVCLASRAMPLTGTCWALPAAWL